ncbi:MAG: hypothetical protein H7837_08715 [Magnetococcus sp. MYC-9]
MKIHNQYDPNSPGKKGSALTAASIPAPFSEARPAEGGAYGRFFVAKRLDGGQSDGARALRQPDSGALRANLRETLVDQVTIDPRQEVLRTVVGRDAGILKTLDRLLTEWNHPFRNWRIILPELRAFVLKNATRFAADDRGADCFSLFCDLFLGALEEQQQEASAHLALEGLTAYIEKMATLITPPRLPGYAAAFDRLFHALSAMSVERLLLLAQTHHPLRRTVTTLLRKGSGNAPPPGSPPDLPVGHPLPVRHLPLLAAPVRPGVVLRAGQRHLRGDLPPLPAGLSAAPGEPGQGAP